MNEELNLQVTEAPEQAPEVVEQAGRTYSPDEVTAIVQRERERALRKGAGQQAPSVSQDEIRRMIAEEAPRYMQEQAKKAQMDNLVSSFVGKIEAAKEEMPGLSDSLNELNITPEFTPVIAMANDLPNTAAVMNELVSNPMKMGYIVSLMQTQPKMAAKAMYDLSQSIEQNRKAVAENQESRAPLDQIKQTSKGLGNGTPTIADFKKMFRA